MYKKNGPLRLDIGLVILDLVWLICLMAYQLLMDYLMLKFDQSVKDWFNLFV